MLQNKNKGNGNPVFLTTWSATGKRGRKPTNTAITSFYSSSSSEDHDTAHFLLMLSSSATTATTTTTTTTIITTQKDVKNSLNQHQCESCGKRFQSHQALGGHRASHVKVKKTRVALVEEHPQTYYESSGDQVFDQFSIDVSPSFRGVKKHKCSICNKKFSSGQALGGHKRCHWEGKSDIASNHNNGARKKKKKERLISRLCFDLNLPPPPLSSSDEEDCLSKGTCSPASPLEPYCYS